MKLHKRNRSPQAPRSRAALAWLGSACFFVGGCSSTGNGAKDDPLFGVRPAQVAPVPPANPGNNNLPTQSRITVPPIPGTTSGGSTASLASLPGARPLSINNPPPAPVSANPNVSMGPSVQPIPREAPNSPGLLTTGSWTQAAPATTPMLPAPSEAYVDPHFAALQARGATNQKVENVAQGVRLTVLVPDRANPTASRIYEATARDASAAAQAVLLQIEQQGS